MRATNWLYKQVVIIIKAINEEQTGPAVSTPPKTFQIIDQDAMKVVCSTVSKLNAYGIMTNDSPVTYRHSSYGQLINDLSENVGKTVGQMIAGNGMPLKLPVWRAGLGRLGYADEEVRLNNFYLAYQKLATEFLPFRKRYDH